MDPEEYTYPVGAELSAIGQEFMAALTLDDPIFGLFPITPVNNHHIEWEQRDNYLGLQQIRGLNGEPPRVLNIGGKRYLYEPGIYGEFRAIDETELTRRRPWGQRAGTVDIGDLTGEAQEHLTVREVARMRQICWLLATTGTFAISNQHGAIVYQGTFPIQTFTSTVTWSTRATATPIADLRAVKLLGRGRGANFGRGARAFANQVTINRMLANTNADDLGGRRVVNGPFNLEDANKIAAGEDLPQIEVMDDGYFDDAGVFRLFVPDGVISIVGQRPGNARLGEYRMTRNVNNPGGAPGAYDIIWESPKPPKRVEVHRGHNGGPVIYWPGAVVRMNVG